MFEYTSSFQVKVQAPMSLRAQARTPAWLSVPSPARPAAKIWIPAILEASPLENLITEDLSITIDAWSRNSLSGRSNRYYANSRGGGTISPARDNFYAIARRYECTTGCGAIRRRDKF